MMEKDASAVSGKLLYEQAYFERGFIAFYAWMETKRRGERLSDAVIDHAWDHRDEGMGPTECLPRRAPAVPAASDDVGVERNPMCDPHVNWLVHQLEAWPERVDSEKTTNITYLMQEAAKAIRSQPLATTPKPASDTAADYNGHTPNRYVPTLPDGASLFAVNPANGSWHYVNHAGTWQGMPSPLSASDAAVRGAALRGVDAMIENIERWRETGDAASPAESKVLYEGLLASRAALSTPTPEAVGEGFVMVPRECTDEIAEAICGVVNVCGGFAESIWSAAVLAASPLADSKEVG